MRGIAALAAALAVTVAACGGDDDASSTTGLDTTAATTPETMTTATTTDRPATTDAATTTEATEATATTMAPTTVAPASTAAPAVPRPIVAVSGDGDAIYLSAPDAAPVLLYDGPDPELPPPDEGPGPNVVDGVAVTSDGSQAWIGLCCEPVAGSILETTPPTLAEGPQIMFGTAPALDPSESFLAVGLPDATGAVRDLATGEVTAGFDTTGSSFSAFDTLWIDDATFLVLGIWQDDLADEWRIIESTLGATALGRVISVVPFDGSTFYRFAGIIDDTIVGVHQPDAAEVLSVDVDTEEVDSVPLPGPARSYWFRAGGDVWVDSAGGLSVGDVAVPGEYVWAR